MTSVNQLGPSSEALRFAFTPGTRYEFVIRLEAHHLIVRACTSNKTAYRPEEIDRRFTVDGWHAVTTHTVADATEIAYQIL